MIEFSTKQKRTPTTIRRVKPLGPPLLDPDDQWVYETLKPRLDNLLIQPSTACVQAIVRYAQSCQGKG